MNEQCEYRRVWAKSVKKYKKHKYDDYYFSVKRPRRWKRRDKGTPCLHFKRWRKTRKQSKHLSKRAELKLLKRLLAVQQQEEYEEIVPEPPAPVAAPVPAPVPAPHVPAPPAPTPVPTPTVQARHAPTPVPKVRALAPAHWTNYHEIPQKRKEIDNVVRAAVKKLSPHDTTTNLLRDKELSGVIKLRGKINGQEIAEHDIKMIKTESDGTCLIHAFLTSCSDKYRSLPYSDDTAKMNRSIVGKWLRHNVFDFPGNDWLYDDAIPKLAAYAGVRFIYIKLTADKRIREVERMGDYGPFVLLTNIDGTHFTAATFKKQYLVSKYEPAPTWEVNVVGF
jgi:hypothetical protein